MLKGFLNEIELPLILRRILPPSPTFYPGYRSQQKFLVLMMVFDILYDIAEADRLVNVLVVGEKRGNQLYVLGREYTAHASDRPIRGQSEP
jgi:hypothetical protein